MRVYFFLKNGNWFDEIKTDEETNLHSILPYEILPALKCDKSFWSFGYFCESVGKALSDVKNPIFSTSKRSPRNSDKHPGGILLGKYDFSMPFGGVTKSFFLLLIFSFFFVVFVAVFPAGYLCL